MPMETMGFRDKESRDALWRTWGEEKSEGLARYSTHIDNKPEIVYCVTRREPTSTVVPETQPSQGENLPARLSTDVPLTSPAALDMLDEGGNSDEILVINSTSEVLDTVQDGEEDPLVPKV